MIWSEGTKLLDLISIYTKYFEIEMNPRICRQNDGEQDKSDKNSL